jgi:hypothetical protein
MQARKEDDDVKGATAAVSETGLRLEEDRAATAERHTQDVLKALEFQLQASLSP